MLTDADVDEADTGLHVDYRVSGDLTGSPSSHLLRSSNSSPCIPM